MDDPVIAGRYAKALFEVAASHGHEDRLSHDLEIAAPILKNLEPRLSYPGFSIEQKKTFLTDALKDKVSPLALQFFYLLIEKHRFSLWPLAFSRFSIIFSEKKNKMKADVFVSRVLDAETQKNLAAQLGKFTGKNIELNIKEDSNLIGGIMVRLGDWVMDSSLQGRLKRMRETFNGN